jgi:hypothetical protein
VVVAASKAGTQTAMSLGLLGGERGKTAAKVWSAAEMAVAMANVAQQAYYSKKLELLHQQRQEAQKQQGLAGDEPEPEPKAETPAEPEKQAAAQEPVEPATDVVENAEDKASALRPRTGVEHKHETDVTGKHSDTLTGKAGVEKDVLGGNAVAGAGMEQSVSATYKLPTNVWAALKSGDPSKVKEMFNGFLGSLELDTKFKAGLDLGAKEPMKMGQVDCGNGYTLVFKALPSAFAGATANASYSTATGADAGGFVGVKLMGEFSCYLMHGNDVCGEAKLEAAINLGQRLGNVQFIEIDNMKFDAHLLQHLQSMMPTFTVSPENPALNLFDPGKLEL